MADQLDIFADVDAPLVPDGFPVLINAWEIREEDRATTIVLVAPPRYEVDPRAAQDGKTAGAIAGEFKIATPPDKRKYYPVKIACPEGWTVEPGPAGGVGMFVDSAGDLVATSVALRNGDVKIIEYGLLPDHNAGRQPRKQP